MYLHIPRDFCKRDRQLEDRLRRLVRDTIDAVDAAEATIWVIAADEASLYGVINTGPTRQKMEQVTVAITPSAGSNDNQAVIGLVLQTQQPMCTGPDDRYDESVDRWTGTKTETMAAVPIRIDQDVVGVLSAINRTGRRLFDDLALDDLQWRAYLIGLVLRDYGAVEAGAPEGLPFVE